RRADVVLSSRRRRRTGNPTRRRTTNSAAGRRASFSGARAVRRACARQREPACEGRGFGGDGGERGGDDAGGSALTRVRWIACCAALFVWLVPGLAAAGTRFYVIAIGNNEPPLRTAKDGGETLAPLRYADDDASAIARLGRELGAETTLLT